MPNPFPGNRRDAFQLAVQNVVLPVLLFTLIVDAAVSACDLAFSRMPDSYALGGPVQPGRLFVTLFRLQGDVRAVVTAAAMLAGVYVLRRRIAVSLAAFRNEEEIRKRAAGAEMKAAGAENRQAALAARSAFYVASAVVFSVMLNALLSLTGILPASAADQQTMQLMYSASPLTAAAVYGFVSPFSEEMVFRGLALTGLRAILVRTCASARRAEGLAILFSALLFGLYHLNPAQMLYAFAMGLWIGWGMMRTGKLSCAVMMHMAVNLVSVFMTYKP